MFKKLFKNKIRVIFWLILATLVAWLLYMAIIPNGKINYSNNFAEGSKFIRKLTPVERVLPVAENMQKIIGDPVYFSLWTPRRFTEAKLFLKYRIPSEVELNTIEAGVLVDNIVWRYELKPVENKIIDQLSLVWDVISEDDLMLMQREKNYNSIDEFFNNLPVREKIAIYNTNINEDYILPDYIKGIGQVIDYPLRGNYEFYTYIDNEDLEFDFTYYDLNKNKDSDGISLNLYYANKIIADEVILDDGNTNDNGIESSEKIINFKKVNLPTGAYKIEWKAKDDIITEKIVTAQSKLAFINNIRLYNAEKTNIKIFTDSQVIKAKTINPGSLQIIKAGSEELEISETYKQYSKTIENIGQAEIILEKDGIFLAGNGNFSFSADSLFNPEFKKVAPELDILKQGVDFVLAKYKTPEEKDGWRQAQIDFDLNNVYRESGKYSFLISVPGLMADDEIDDYIEIDEIRVELRGKTLWEKIREKISNF